MRQLTQAAQAAKLIRKELKTAFPGVKFRVQSQNYSMGNSIYIYYPRYFAGEELRTIGKKYQLGRFDGMTDSYEYTNKREDIPQVDYVLFKIEHD